MPEDRYGAGSEKTLREVEKLVENGYKEIVLTGIHTGAYGQDLPQGYDLNLVGQPNSPSSGLARLRISSYDPNEFIPDFIDTISNHPVICPHFHISCKVGDDDILERMRRSYTTEEYRQLVKTQIRNTSGSNYY